MHTPLKIAALAAAALSLAGCATVPDGPTVMVLPGQGKSFEQFQQDNRICRQYAYNEIGGTSAQRAANATTLKSAGVGALLGGALGAAAGNSRGAGIGAAGGALAGTAVGSSNAYGDAYGAQQRYNNAYEQCMYAKGNRIPVAGGRYGSRGHHPYPPPPPGYQGNHGPYYPPPPPGAAPPDDDASG